MKKLAVVTWVGAIAFAAFALFQVKNDVKQLERALAQEHRALLEAQEAIHVLNAEWSYLNHPGRIAELAQRHLQLAPIGSDHVVQIDDLPFRYETEQNSYSDIPAQPGMKPTPTSAKAPQ